MEGTCLMIFLIFLFSSQIFLSLGRKAGESWLLKSIAEGRMDFFLCSSPSWATIRLHLMGGDGLEAWLCCQGLKALNSSFSDQVLPVTCCVYPGVSCPSYSPRAPFHHPLTGCFGLWSALVKSTVEKQSTIIIIREFEKIFVVLNPVIMHFMTRYHYKHFVLIRKPVNHFL